jgi:excinuclease ABC subunit C
VLSFDQEKLYSVEVKKKTEKIAPECGVYIFRNSQREVVYVGKAKNIFKRVSITFTTGILLPKKRYVEEIDTIGYFLVPDEHQLFFWKMN